MVYVHILTCWRCFPEFMGSYFRASNLSLVEESPPRQLDAASCSLSDGLIYYLQPTILKQVLLDAVKKADVSACFADMTLVTGEETPP